MIAKLAGLWEVPRHAPDPEFPHLTTRDRWEEVNPWGSVVTHGIDWHLLAQRERLRRAEEVRRDP